MIEISYFASVREKLNIDKEQVELSQQISCAGDIFTYLHAKGGAYKDLFSPNNNLHIAINQQIVKQSAQLHDGDEVAIFPTVTGG